MADFGLLLLLLFACGCCGGGFGAFEEAVLGPYWGCVLLSPFCLWFLSFGRVLRVVSPAPELSKLPANIMNSYAMYVQMYKNFFRMCK